VAGMSVRAYAAHRKKLGLPGGSPTAVQNAITSGRITRGPDGKIDPATADVEWEANSNPSKRRQPRAQMGPSLAQSKAVEAAYKAKTARLDYLERTGELVPVESVRREAFERGRNIREAIMSVPSRVAADVFAAETIADAEQIIENELRNALRGLAE